MNNGNVVGLETRYYIEGVTWLGKVDTGISLYVIQSENKGNKKAVTQTNHKISSVVTIQSNQKE